MNDRRTSNSTYRTFGLVALLAIVVLGAAWWVDREPEPLVIDEQADFERRLVELCHKRILSQLKAPSEARFLPNSKVEQNAEDGAYWRVSGAVDARNSFGGIVRENYSCDLIAPENGLPSILLSGLGS